LARDLIKKDEVNAKRVDEIRSATSRKMSARSELKNKILNDIKVKH